MTLVLVTLLTLLPHISSGLTLPLELSLALPLGFCVLNRPLRNLTLPLVDVGALSVHLVPEVGEAHLAPDAVVGETDEGVEALYGVVDITETRLGVVVILEAGETDVGVVVIADAILKVVVVAEDVLGGVDVAGAVVDGDGGTELILAAAPKGVLREAAVSIVDITRAVLLVVVVADAVVSEAGEAVPDLEAVVREAGGALLAGKILK